MRRTRLPMMVVAWLTSTAPLAAAQQRRFSCAEAARLVIGPELADTQAHWAFSEIVGCPDGPAAIATRWRTTDDLHHLRTWNYMIRDQRIAEAVLAVARDASRPTDLRLMALETLIGYFDSSATIRLEELRNPRRFPSLASVTHPTTRVGTQPPAQDLPDRVYALSRDLTADPNPAVARAAKAVWQALTDARPAIASLPAGTVTMENLCGATFHITNNSDIDLSVELATTPEKPVRQIRLPARATRELGARDSGTVRLLLTGGRELASARTGPECR
jgi:hypothetical protein